MIEKIKATYKQIKTWFWALPVWKRAILSSIIGALGGSSIIGFFNRYALYYHAICQEFRVPVEGVEYLDLAVTLMSFAIMITSILGTILIYSILNFIAEFFAKVIVPTENKRRSERVKLILMITQLVAGVMPILWRFIQKFYGESQEDIEFEIPFQLIIILISAFIFIILGLIFSRSEQNRKMFTLFVVLAGISLITISLFNQTIYKSFLESIQYGGEIPIGIEYRKADNTQASTKGLLLIRTKSSVTIKNEETGNIEEIPNERISKMIFEK